MATLSNASVADFFKTNGKQKCLEFIIEKFKNSNDQSEFSPTEKSFQYSIKKVTEKIEKLNKSKGRAPEELSHYLNAEFVFPKADIKKRVPHSSVEETLDFKAALLTEKLSNQKLVEDVIQSKHSLESKTHQLEQSHEQVKQLKLNLKRTASREAYANKKIQKIEDSANERCCREKIDKIKQLEATLKEKEREINELNASVQYLNDLLVDGIDKVNLFDEKSKRYTQPLKHCVYELLTLNVSASKVGEVITAVLKLVNKQPDRVPSKSTVLSMNLQRLCLAHKQLAEVFSEEKHTCLMTDETSKFGKKVMGYEASDSKGNFWVLGLRDIETKSAEDTLKVFREILSDLGDIASDESVSRDIICHISSTMADRAATEIKFNELLEVYRKEVLPLTYVNYHTFTDEEKAHLEHLSNFFCGLHALVNYAEAAQKSMRELENRVFDNNVPISDISFASDEPGACRLVRTATKCFGEGSGGDEKSGCQSQFSTYISDFLAENHLKSVPLRGYKGSRFNVLFNNACSVFFLHEQMLSYLETVGCTNRLQKAILFDLKVPEFLAGVKALALISKLVTCPLWCILEDKHVSLMDMNTKYLELVTFLEDASHNVDSFMSGNMIIFEEHVKKDSIFEHLLVPREYDDIVERYLEIILATLCQLGKKLYKEHLPGGNLQDIDPEITRGAPKTSCFAESVFGQLDQLMRTKPNVSTLAAEACIMFVNNRTMAWLQSKEDKERNKLIAEASSQVKQCKTTYRARLQQIQIKRKERIQEKVRQKERQEQEKIRKQTEYTNSIISHGLWQSEMEIDNMLQSYSTKTQQIEVLKAQIRFRKEVLSQVPDDKKTFNFSKSVEGRKSRQSLNPEELKSNLKTLVRQAVVRNKNHSEEHILVGKRVRHRLEVEDGGSTKKIWYTGKVISQVPSFPEWFNIVYDGDKAVYTYHRLDTDQDTADLQILV